MEVSKRGWIEKGLIYGAIPLAVAFLVIVKIFLVRNCFAFDSNDDTVHTFPNLAAAQAAFRAGQIPMMNLFNNFGTPLIGDCFTFPLGISFLTYFFLPDPLAMTVNRFIISFFTMAALTLYYRKSFSAPVASLCAALVFFSPATLWSITCHQYQMPVLCAALIFFLQEKFSETGERRWYILIYLVWLVFVSTTSIHPVMLIVALASCHQFFLGASKKNTFLFFAAVAAAFIFWFPDIFSFFYHIAGSQRVQNTYGLSFSLSEMVHFVAFGINSLKMHDPHQIMVYLSVPVLMAVSLGICALWKKKEVRLLSKCLVLGVFPVVLMCLCLGFPRIYSSIPVLRATDITRLLWGSNIFLMFLAGQALESFKEESFSFKELVIFGIFFLMMIGSIFLFLPWGQISFLYRLPLLPAIFGFLILLIFKKNRLSHD